MTKPFNASDAAMLRRSLINLASLMLLVILSVGIAGLFSVWSMNQFQTRIQLALNEVGATMLDTRHAQVHFKTQVQDWKTSCCVATSWKTGPGTSQHLKPKCTKRKSCWTRFLPNWTTSHTPKFWPLLKKQRGFRHPGLICPLERRRPANTRRIYGGE